MPFPSVLSSFNKPAATDRLNSPSHSALHNTVSSALGQVEAVIGIDGASSVVGTIMYDLRSPASGGGGHVQIANKGGTGQTTYTKGDILVAQSSSVISKLTIGADNTVLIADSTQNVGARWGGGKFGGTGSDGALNITSGTTTISLASVVSLVKNYTSISITGTGALVFSSPNTNGSLVILKSQGNVTLTSSTAPVINCASLGSTGGAGFSGANGNGTVGSDAVSTIATVKGGTGGVSGGDTTGGAGFNRFGTLQTVINGKVVPIFAGAGGGGGGCSSGSAGGAGGRGGGGIYIECAGALNFSVSSIISVSGANGTNGSGGTNSGGGGGGAGGSAIILYSSLTASVAGAVVVTAGAGGVPVGTGNGGGGGGNMNDGNANSSGTGGAGATGLSLITSNTEYF